MTIFQAIILGIVQGLTEFLPVSSSAHLVLVPFFLNWKIPDAQIFPFDVLVQFGTIVAVILYFWKDLLAIIKAFIQGLVSRQPFADPNARLGWLIIAASIPAGIFGLLIKKLVEDAFNDPMAVGFFLLGTAILLVIAELVGTRTRTLAEITWKDALWIGAFQAISVFPGISRSGSTITGALTRNFNRRDAARFSFLMSIPIMVGASLYSLKDLADVPNLTSFLPVVLVGILVAGVIGYLSIAWLLSYISKRSFYIFAIYCAILGAITIIIAYVR